MRYAFPARFKRDVAGRWTVSFPDIPEALTDGASKEDALREAVDALGGALAGYVHEGRAVPEPSSLKGGRRM